MAEFLLPYCPGVLALGVLGVLYLAQLGVADVVAVTRRHTPGTPVESSHDDFLFRATRAHANTTESIGAAILIAGFAIAAAGSPGWVNGTLCGFVGFRALHTAAYYANLSLLRSVAFGCSFGALLLLFGLGVAAL